MHYIYSLKLTVPLNSLIYYDSLDFRYLSKTLLYMCYIGVYFVVTLQFILLFTVKSRVLLSLREEEDLTWYHPYGPPTPRSQQEFSDPEKSSAETNQKDTNPTEPVITGRLEVVTVDQRFHQVNCSSPKNHENLHPEIISPIGLGNPCIEKSVETETAWSKRGTSLRLMQRTIFFKCCYFDSRLLLWELYYILIRLFSALH